MNLFLDENVQELLRRRASLVEDDNPDSPSTSTNNNVNQTSQSQPLSNQYGPSSQQQTGGPGSQQQSHIFLPPTSPAVMQQSRGGTGVPTPSPVHHNYFAQSPGMTSAPASNAPSIAQSPGGAGGGGSGVAASNANTSSGALFANFGSPAIPHSSPAANSSQQILPPGQSSTSQQQPQSQQHPSSHHQHMIQSPADFMSPAASNQPPNYATQSPGNYSGKYRVFFFFWIRLKLLFFNLS